MSLRGKDFRCDLDPELHAKLRKLADLKGYATTAPLGRLFLEKMIVAEWHDASIFVERVVRSGIARNPAERVK